MPPMPQEIRKMTHDEPFHPYHPCSLAISPHLSH